MVRTRVHYKVIKEETIKRLEEVVNQHLYNGSHYLVGGVTCERNGDEIFWLQALGWNETVHG